ncbi:hypothetical protein GH733_017245, partial [Mirounga leonina]
MSGLLFRGLAWIHPRTHTPIVATIVSGTFAAFMAFLFELSDLVDLMSIGTLLVYSWWSFPFLFSDENLSKNERTEVEISEIKPAAQAGSSQSVPEVGTAQDLPSLHNPVNTTSTLKSGRIVHTCTLVLVAQPSAVRRPGVYHRGRVAPDAHYWAHFHNLRQPQNPTPLHFKVPALPVLPLLSIFVNVYLMMQMTAGTWARFGIWMVIGFAIYFGYGIRHSLEKDSDQQPPVSSSHTLDKNILSVGNSQGQDCLWGEQLQESDDCRGGGQETEYRSYS